MERFKFCIFYCLVLLSLAFTEVSAQQNFKVTATPSAIGYLEYVPADYYTNSNPYPVVFFLHGIGERGADSTDPAVLSTTIQNVAKHGPPMYVKNGNQFPFILISPQLKSSYGSWPANYIMEVINHCKTYLRIDERKIILTGLSLGGGGTWSAAQTYPELFAAIAPVCGSGNSPSKACNLAGENLPVWAFHGDKDTTVPMSKTVDMVNAINNCVPAPSPLAKLTIYTGVAHNAWDKAYTIDHSIHNPNVYEWMLSYTNIFNKGNKIPVANAGADKIVSSTTSSTSLTGSGTDEDGTITTYAWTQISGTTLTLTNASTTALTVSGLAIGEYTFKLKVTDNSGNTNSDYVKLTVESNTPPLANAGVDKTITLPTNSVNITGTGTDADGTIASYQWIKISGGAITLDGMNTTNLQVTNALEGSYVFELTVTDNSGAKCADRMMLKVNAPVVPLVNAGADKVVKLPTSSATIDGAASDADGTIVSYAWTKVSGGVCTMSYANTASLKLKGLASGTYTFRLTATDNNGYSGSDDVTVVVDAPPVVNAGADQTVTLPMTNLVLNGSATDADGTIVKYLWSKYSGPNVSIVNTSLPSITITRLYEGVYVFKLAVTDHLGAQGIDYVTVTVKAGTTTSSISQTSTTQSGK